LAQQTLPWNHRPEIWFYEAFAKRTRKEKISAILLLTSGPSRRHTPTRGRLLLSPLDLPLALPLLTWTSWALRQGSPVHGASETGLVAPLERQGLRLPVRALSEGATSFLCLLVIPVLLIPRELNYFYYLSYFHVCQGAVTPLIRPGLRLPALALSRFKVYGLRFTVYGLGFRV